MDKNGIYQDLNFVRPEASKSEEISSSELSDSNAEKVLSSRYNEIKQIKAQMISGFRSRLKIIPIVGMGGIGKTYLAKSIYSDIEISYHFHVQAWATVSQEYKLRNVLLDLLRSFVSISYDVAGLTDQELTEMLYKSLKGRRYLIVLDDMWSTSMWNDFKPIFPNDNNGSRIILTTRLMEVAASVDLDSPPHSMKCLSNDESWKLLCNGLFVGQSCPPHLVEIGRRIAKKCQGLPLAVAVVAGYISKIEMNHDCWADIAKRLDSLITGNEEQILDILCLSYNNLPQHLKACFLYMGIFPKNSEMHVLKLIRLWTAVGFVRSEDEAENCLEDLISRNLIMVRKKQFDGTAKTCGIHDLMWDLSLREARKEGHYIFSLSNSRHSGSDATTDDTEYLMSLASTYIYSGSSFETDFPLISVCFRQLRVLNIQSQSFSCFPDEITDLVDLRYLELSTCGNIPASVSNLWKLETLINNHKLAGPVLPKEIWLLRHLQHLKIGTYTFLPPPSCATVDGSSVLILPDLQRLSTVSLASCTDQVFSSIPNVKRLKICGIKGEEEYLSDCLNNLIHLHHLENLNLDFREKIQGQVQNSCWDTLPQCIEQLALRSSGFPGIEMSRQPQNLCRYTFPKSLKKLTLRESRLPWVDMDILAMLPNLVVLKLKKNAFKGPVYEQTDEGFPRLKFLLFEDLDLERWITETIQFPVLRRLVLRSCYSLEGIPSCIGEIPTLDSIELSGCSSSVYGSARTIQKEQRSMGNYALQVIIGKKVVLRLSLHCAKCRTKAMKTVSCLEGVESIRLEMGDKMIVTGDADPIKIASNLRKRVGYTEIVSVGPADMPDTDVNYEPAEVDYCTHRNALVNYVPSTGVDYESPVQECVIM